MGDASPWRALHQAHLPYDKYFSSFCQVTNPPIDPLREELG